MNKFEKKHLNLLLESLGSFATNDAESKIKHAYLFDMSIDQNSLPIDAPVAVNAIEAIAGLSGQKIKPHKDWQPIIKAIDDSTKNFDKLSKILPSIKELMSIKLATNYMDGHFETFNEKGILKLSSHNEELIKLQLILKALQKREKERPLQGAAGMEKAFNTFLQTS